MGLTISNLQNVKLKEFAEKANVNKDSEEDAKILDEEEISVFKNMVDDYITQTQTEIDENIDKYNKPGKVGTAVGLGVGAISGFALGKKFGGNKFGILTGVVGAMLGMFSGKVIANSNVRINEREGLEKHYSQMDDLSSLKYEYHQLQTLQE